MRHITTVQVLLASLCYGSMAQAGWLGQTVTAEWYVPDNVTVIETHNVAVGAGVELPFGSIVNGPILSIDLSDTEVRFEVSSLAIFSPTSVNGWKFSDTTNSIPDIAGVSVGPMSGGVNGLANSDLSFDANSIFVNLESVTAAGAGDFWTLKVEFVPEPGSLVLAAWGFVGLLARAWRRRYFRA